MIDWLPCKLAKAKVSARIENHNFDEKNVNIRKHWYQICNDTGSMKSHQHRQHRNAPTAPKHCVKHTQTYLFSKPQLSFDIKTNSFLKTKAFSTQQIPKIKQLQFNFFIIITLNILFLREFSSFMYHLENYKWFFISSLCVCVFFVLRNIDFIFLSWTLNNL